MTAPRPEKLSRRERQIMDVVFRLEQATVAQVREELADPPSYSAVRALMRILEEKGHLKHEQRGNRYVYRPTRSRKQAAQAALKRVLDTFFDNSAEQAVVALLDAADAQLPQAELDRLLRKIQQAQAKETDHDVSTRKRGKS